MLNRLLLSTALCGAVITGACTTDERGNQCPLSEAYQTDDGETYCEDPLAPEDCERLVSVILDRTSECSGIDRQSLEAEFDAPFDCDDAVATTTAFDDCVEGIETGECVDITVAFPESCQGVVRTAE